MFVDSHLHLDFDDFAEDREAVMARAKAAGIDAYVNIGIRVRSAARVIAIAERYPNVFCTVGTLPHMADEEADVTAEEIITLTRHPKVIGIGEAGLDRLYGNADWNTQKRVFSAHIEAAQQTGLPLVIHSVREDDTMSEMLRAAMSKKPFAFVVHAFSGGPLLLETTLDLGGYFGFGGLLTYRDNEHIRHAAQRVPMERILLETDSPSMVPAPLEGDRNEPANLLTTATLLAALRGIEIDVLAKASTDNFYRLFSKAGRM
ncbi:TatD family hydrolase [Devosia sp. BK]|uniref:TatD family hydrolase n=1 Tax=Devosia sp. BK TaxID=2871706 RepID=UPI00293A602B|nr:TatD family hydrolase [Devosia sp. BK]MDV3253159.1 TatD family hydrolase [Devosia sp. BK]